MSRKHQEVPTDPTRTAASAGPKMRDPVMTAVLSDVALEMSSGSTSSMTRPRRAGFSNALSTPSRSVSPHTTPTLRAPARSRSPSTNAWAASAPWVTMASVRLSRWSAMAPAHAPSSSMGRNCRANVIPTSVARPVRRYTSSAIAVSWSHVPMLETSSPAKKTRVLW